MIDNKHSDHIVSDFNSFNDLDLILDVSFENLLPGDIFNQRWKILKQIGRGGFGVVYHALDLHIEGRSVAIKILTIDTVKYPEALMRFKKEVSITSNLKSPNTLVVYDFGVIHKSAYMISELLIGETLEDKIKNQKFISIDESLNIVKFVALALLEAHQANIVHRDIKPDNIYLNQTSEGYEVKLIDFGIAKVTEMSSKVTATNSFLGTPLYMSPEQIKDTSKVDATTDIYSLGLVLYTCIVGKPPFEDSDFYMLLKKQVEEKTPSIAFPHQKYDQINHLISQMTEKNIEKRMPTIKDVIDMISLIQNNLKNQSQSYQSKPQEPSQSYQSKPQEPSQSSNFHYPNHSIDLHKKSLNSNLSNIDISQKRSINNSKNINILLFLLIAIVFLILTYEIINKQTLTDQPVLKNSTVVDSENYLVSNNENKTTTANHLKQKENLNKNKKNKDKAEENFLTSKINHVQEYEQDENISKKQIINFANQYKSEIYSSLELKIKSIQKCIHLYQADFNQEYLNLKFDFLESEVKKLSCSHVNEKTLSCLTKVINKITFQDHLKGSVNIKLLLPKE